MLKIAICGEQLEYLKEINELVYRFLNKKGISNEIHIFSFRKEILYFAAGFDILFLDVEEDSKHVIEAAEKLRKQNKKITIVFFSKTSRNWGKAFQIHAFDFIRGPITKIKIEKVLEDYFFLMEEVNRKNVCFLLPKGVIILDVDDIVYFYYKDKKHIKLKTMTEEYVIKENLYDIYDKLNDNFYIPHRCCIVNINYIKKIDNYEIFMKNGEILPLAQKKKKDFLVRVYNFVNWQKETNTNNSQNI